MPSPIDLRLTTDARVWAAKAERRPGRAEILDPIAQAAAGLAPAKGRVLELGSGPGVLANAELYMTKAEQKEALLAAGFTQVEHLAVAGSLTLHLACKT